MQSSVTNTFYASGLVGEFSRAENADSKGAMLNSANQALNLISVAVKNSTTDDNVVGVAAAGALVGLLGQPKALVRPSLDAQAFASNGQEVTVLRRGYVWVTISTTAAIGDYVYYSNTTGVLATYAPTAVPGAGFTRLPGGKVVDNTVTVAGTAEIYFDVLAGSTETPTA